METWNKLIANENLFSSFYIDNIINNTERLFITLKNNDHLESIEIVFDQHMFAGRTIPKNCFLKTIKRLDKIYGINFCASWSCFKVENSDYLKWLHEQSYGIYENDREEYKMKHYVFIGSNLVFEVLTHCPPRIIIKNNL